ncbi:hypothetical protein BH24ACT26_BH24ACT26_12240 [soil metagenome]
MRAPKLASIVILVVAIMALMGPALAGHGSGEQPPKVDDEITQRDPQNAEERSSTLPFTGGDVLAFVLVGTATVGAGGVLMHRTRGRVAKL